MKLIRNRGLLVLLIICVISAVVAPTINVSYIYPSFTKLLIETSENEAQRTAKHLSLILIKNVVTSIEQEQITNAFSKEVEMIQTNFRIMKVKLFSAKGETLFSTEKKDIGMMNTKEYFHQKVAKGEIFSKVVKKGHKSLEDQLVWADVVETYVPIMKDDVFIGAFELYYDVTDRLLKQAKIVHDFSILPYALTFVFLLFISIVIFRLDAILAERQTLQDNLSKSENKFREVVESAQEWIWEVDSHGLYIDSSSIVESLIGYSVEEVVGKKHFYDFFHPDEREEFKEKALTVFEQKGVLSKFANRNIHKNGTTVWLSTSGRPILDENGNLLGYRGVDSDISAIKESEIALLKYNRELSELSASLTLSNEESLKQRKALDMTMNHISDLIKSVADRQDYSIRFPNPNLCTCYITKQCEQKECPCYGKDSLRCWQIDGTHCGDEIQGNFANKIENCVTCEVFKRATSDPVYEVSEYFNNMMNILESNNQKLQESEERYRSLSETAYDGIVSAGSEGNINYCNTQAGKMFGYSIAEMKGKPLTILLPVSFREAHEKGMARFLATNKPEVIGKIFEVVGLRKNGDEFPLEMSIATWESGSKKYFTGIMRDITERKQMEEDLILDKKNLLALTVDLEKINKELKSTQAQMLHREKMASVGQLAAGVAHEINNPMGFITGNLGALKNYVAKYLAFIETQSKALSSLNAEGLVKEAREKLKLDFLISDTNDLLAESLDGAKRVSEIVQNLKCFSRIDEDLTAPSDINECLESTLKIIWNELKYKVILHKDYGELPLTLCNSQELNQVFMNILVNASHAIQEQGEITIRTWQEDALIMVTITDTGTGIAQDELTNIFEPFFTTKEVGKGTGLGLSICYDIVKKHEGEILVKSEMGKGTEFTIKIPVKEVENNDV